MKLLLIKRISLMSLTAKQIEKCIHFLAFKSKLEVRNLFRSEPYKDELSFIFNNPHIWEESLYSKEEIKSCIDDTPQTNLHDDVDIAERYIDKKKNAIKRGKDFLLGFSEYKKLTRRKVCFYTKLQFTAKNHFTLDRIECSIGYTKENTVPCCSEFNSLKAVLFEEPNSFWYGKEELLLKSIERLINEKKKLKRTLNENSSL